MPTLEELAGMDSTIASLKAQICAAKEELKQLSDGNPSPYLAPCRLANVFLQTTIPSRALSLQIAFKRALSNWITRFSPSDLVNGRSLLWIRFFVL